MTFKNYHKRYTCRLSSDSSLFTAELWAILLALRHVHFLNKKSLLVLSDSLSSFQASQNMKSDHPFLTKIHELYSDLIRDGKEIVFVWVPGHIGISGNSAADTAAKDAVDNDVSENRRDYSIPAPYCPFIYDSLFHAERRKSSFLYAMHWVDFFRARVTELLRFKWCRKKGLHANPLRMLFRDVSLDSILHFLKEINAFNKL